MLEIVGIRTIQFEARDSDYKILTKALINKEVPNRYIDYSTTPLTLHHRKGREKPVTGGLLSI